MKKSTETVKRNHLPVLNSLPKKMFVVFVFILAQIYFFGSDFFKLQAVEIDGLVNVKGQELVTFSEIPWGRHLWFVDLRKCRDRIVQMLWVQDVTLKKSYPGTLKIFLKERRPSIAVASSDSPDVWYGADEKGLVLLKLPQEAVGKYPKLILEDKIVKGTLLGEQRIADVLTFVEMLPKDIRSHTKHFVMDGGGYISFIYCPVKRDITVTLGKPEDSEEKMEIFSVIIKQMEGYLSELEYIDLRYKEPVVKRIVPASKNENKKVNADSFSI